MAGDDVLALDEALQNLADKDARKAELVKLRFFAGLTVAQAASVVGGCQMQLEIWPARQDIEVLTPSI